MRWHHLSTGHGVLEIAHGSPFAPALVGQSRPPPIELLVWWGGGEPTRAAWLWTGRVAAWATVGVT